MDNEPILINDYSYNPKPRESFTNGKIMDIMLQQFEAHQDIYRKIIKSIASYQEYHKSLTRTKVDEEKPYIDNGWLPLLDGLMIYTLLGQNNPTYYFEVGSGNTTKYAAKAISDLKLGTKIISVDPNPRASIDPLCTAVFRKPLEELDLEIVSLLSPDDILVIDCSHRAFSNSDVTVFLRNCCQGCQKA